MDGVDIGFPLPPALNTDQAGALKLTDKLGHARTAHAHIHRQPILTGKTGIIVPRITQKHGVGNPSNLSANPVMD
jgi:hypothetical protein